MTATKYLVATFAELGVLILRLALTSGCSDIVHPEFGAGQVLVVR